MDIKGIRIAFVFSLLFLLSFGVWYVNYRWEKSLETSSGRATVIAEAAGDALNGEMLRELDADPQDENTAAYKSIKDRLMRLPDVDNRMRFAYIYTKRDDKLYFIADSEPETSADYSPPGQEYAEADEQYYRPFEEKDILITQPSEDRWGSWVSVLVPMIDPQTGQVIAVFATDYPAKEWDDAAISSAMQAGSTVFILLILLVAVFVIIADGFKAKEIQADLAKFKLATDSTAEHIVITDPEGKILYMNKAAERITGYPIEEAMGTKAGRLWRLPMSKSVYEKLWKVIKSDKKAFIGEIRNRRKNGEIYDAEVNISPVLDEKKNVLFYVGMEKDVTAVKRGAEAAEKLAAIVKDSNEAIIGKDLDGTITEWNAGAASLYGYTAQEAIGKSIKLIVPPEKYEEIDEILDKTARGVKIEHYQTVRTRKDGSNVDVSISVSPVRDFSGKLVGLSTIAFDITREAEIDRAKTEFVSLAAHQLKTPVGALNWNFEMLLGGDYGKLNKGQKEVLEDMHILNSRMNDIINDFLNISRMEMGVFIIEPVPTDFVALCREVLMEMEPRRLVKGHLVTTTFEKRLSRIDADPKLLRIIFQNLISNAIKYTPEKGHIAISIKTDKKDVVFSVSNDGEPIPTSDQPKIFTKLFRASNAQGLDPDGNGLGLYLVKKIVTAARGKVWFSSKKGEETVFSVSFPLSGMAKKTGTKRLS